MNKICGFFLILIIILKSGLAQIYDVLPLNVGNQFIYDYTSSDTTFWVGLFDHIQVDSGQVIYTITDSFASDENSIEWSVSMIANISRYNKQGDSLFGGIDTTYMIIDTLSFKLYESLSGYHLITCGSVLLNDPLSQSMNNEIRIWQFLDYREIYRYSDSAEKAYATARDTLFFKHKIGLVKRTDYFMQETHHWGPVGFDANLSDYIVNIKETHTLPVIQNYNCIINYPNPFNASTVIEFTLLQPASVSFSVYNINSQCVHRQQMGKITAGLKHISFTAGDLPSGLYFYQVLIDNQKILKNKFILLK
ncbi:MAG TPA: T9SS type A sorting domain-containing protein [bacterium]|nr:T9SS type A sorting domain-containing protein [bacterium]HPN44800.1 T9SS type A sorting domain-containing protein [bacterium]